MLLCFVCEPTMWNSAARIVYSQASVGSWLGSGPLSYHATVDKKPGRLLMQPSRLEKPNTEGPGGARRAALSDAAAFLVASLDEVHERFLLAN